MKIKKSGLIYVTLIIFCIGFIIHCGGKSSEEKIVLKLNLEKGKTYSMTVITDQEITQKMMGTKITIEQQLKLSFDFNVLEADETGFEVEVVYTGVGFNQKTPMGSTSYDSDDPSEVVPLLAKGFAALVDESFTMELSPEGDIIDVKGVDLLLSRLVEKQDFLSDAQRNMARNSLKNQFGNEALQSSMEGMMSILPDKPVGIGDSWKKTFDLGGALPMTLKNKWKLKDRKNGIAYISVESEVIPNTDSTPLEMGGIKMEYNLSGDQEGTIQVEEATGWTIEAEIEQDLEGTVKLGGQSIPIYIKGITTLKSKKD